jgi:surface antigen
MKRLLLLLLMISAFGCLPRDVLAINLNFMEDSVIAQFDDKDWEMLQSAVLKALNERDDGSTVSWKNDKSGHWGSVTPLDTTAQAGTKCRRVRFENHTAHETGGSTFRYCHTDAGWKIAP